MKPQDIVILLKLVAINGQSWQYRDLSADLFIPLSEISASLKRSEKAGLFNKVTRKVNRLALMEFIEHGFKYVFPTSPGEMVTGIGTAHSHPFFKKFFRAEMQYAWPHEDGDIRGLMIEPLHPNVPKAIRKDELLYLLLASVDIIRVGRVREKKMAFEQIRRAIDEQGKY